MRIKNKQIVYSYSTNQKKGKIMDVNFNPNNMPLSMRNDVKKQAGDVGNSPKGKTDIAPRDVSQLFGEAQAATATNVDNQSNVYNERGKDYDNMADLENDLKNGNLDGKGEVWGKVGDLYYLYSDCGTISGDGRILTVTSDPWWDTD